jgi:type III secretion protein V
MLTGLEQTKQVLDAARQTDATLVDEALRHLPVPKFCLLFRQMLAEGLTLRHHRYILETVVTLAADGSDIPALTDHVRAGLKRQLSHMHCAADGRIHAVLLPPHLEEALRAALRARPQDSFRALSAEHTRTIVDFVTRSTRTDEAADSAVVLTAFDLRRHLRGLLMQHNIKRAVLSYEEIAPGFELKQLPVIRPEGAAFGRQQPQAMPAQ